MAFFFFFFFNYCLVLGNAAFEWQADSFSLTFWRPQNSQTFTDPTQFSQTFKALKSLSYIPQTNKNQGSGEIKRSWDLRGGRWSWTFKLAFKRSWVGRWSWAEKVGLLLLRVVQVVRQQQSNGRCLSDSVQHSSWNSKLRSAQVAAQWRGDTCLNTSIVLAAVHGLSGLFRAVSSVEPSPFRPLPPLSPSLISHLASVDVKQHWRRSFPKLLKTFKDRANPDTVPPLPPCLVPLWELCGWSWRQIHC